MDMLAALGEAPVLHVHQHFAELHLASLVGLRLPLAAQGSAHARQQLAGAEWLGRFTTHFPKFVWLNPEPEGLWQYRQSITVIRQIMQNRMFPITIEGLERAMRTLSK